MVRKKKNLSSIIPGATSSTPMPKPTADSHDLNEYYEYYKEKYDKFRESLISELFDKMDSFGTEDGRDYYSSLLEDCDNHENLNKSLDELHELIDYQQVI